MEYQTTYSDTTEPGLETIDQLGLRIATLANANAGIDAIYNDSTNEIVLESIQKNTAFTVQVSPTGLAQALRLQAPSTVQIVRSATMDWTPSFSGTATIRVRSIGCDDQRSGWHEVEVSVVPQAITTPTLSSTFKHQLLLIFKFVVELLPEIFLNVKFKLQTNLFNFLPLVTMEIWQMILDL